MKTRALIAAGLVLVLVASNVAIVQKERVLSTGTPMLLRLATVDPRSLMQGDYMRLDYALTRTLDSTSHWPRDGVIVVTLDSLGVVQLVRRHETGVPLARGEHLLRYRFRTRHYRVGTDAFHFQEGSANHYRQARYGELRVDDAGTSVLIGLRDSARVPLH
ncbi:MAG: GDYXXLXY domain-containing protein [bacterium]